MSPLRLNGSISGYSEIEAPANAGSEIFTLPTTGGTLVTSANAGKILQVVQATYGTLVSSTTNTFVDTGLSASITPSSTSSKILALVSHNSVQKNAANTYVHIALLRNGSIIETLNGQLLYTNSALAFEGSIHHTFLDSPASTSALTYKTQFKNPAATGTVYVNTGSGLGASTITLLEVAG